MRGYTVQKDENAMIWITWENQLRNRSMASKLRAKLYEIRLPAKRITRYILGPLHTLTLLTKTRPRIVFAQNPSVVLTVLLILFRPVFRYRLVSDSHFGGVTAYNGNFFFQRLLDFCNRLADLVIVTNDEQARYVASIGGKCCICEDPLPDIAQHYQKEQEFGKSVLFVCSFDIDEPYLEVFSAARLLAEEGYEICVSGNYSKVSIKPEEHPQVVFLGFLPDKEFYRKFYQAHVIVDLTTHENCLVCGAYEAMAAEKPLVTSDRLALRRYFSKGTVFAQDDAESIATAIRHAFENRHTLKKDIEEWKERKIVENTSKIAAIHDVIQAWAR